MYFRHSLKERRLVYCMSQSPGFLLLYQKNECIHKSFFSFLFQELQHIVRSQHIRAEKGKHGSV